MRAFSLALCLTLLCCASMTASGMVTGSAFPVFSHSGTRAVVTLVSLAMWSMLPRVEAGCSPSYIYTCGYSYPYEGCASCTPVNACCYYWSGCGNNCGGDTQINSDDCGFWGWSSKKYCRHCQDITGYACNGCMENYYGQYCNECPGGANNACRGDGWCDWGVNYSGKCYCYYGFAGSECQYSRQYTCNSHGFPISTGTPCSCDTGWAPPTCGSCDSSRNYYPFNGGCRYCTASETCNGHGTCGSTGECNCYSNWDDGAFCASCTDARYHGDSCRYCVAATTCNGYGTCDSQGYCACVGFHQGSYCDVCYSGTWGRPCNSCPGGRLTPCNLHGRCNEGFYFGTGICTCDNLYAGTACNDPVIWQVSPTSGDPNGGTQITVDGVYFGAGGTITLNNQAMSPTSWTDLRITFTTPAGWGQNLLVRVTRADTLSWTSSTRFTYNAPQLYTLEPDTQSTNSGGLHVTGRWFGPGGNVTLDGKLAPNGVVWGTQIYVPIPAGTGAVHNLQVFGGGFRGSNVLTYGYYGPAINRVTPPNGATTGGYNIVIEGSDFGPTPLVVLGGTGSGLSCAIVPPTTGEIITCTVPVGRGVQNVQVTVTGQSAQYNWNYLPATISSVEGCTPDPPSGTKFCDTIGQQYITITGTNFGPTIDHSGHLLKVFINNNECTDLSMVTPFVKLRCRTPAGSGLNRMVEVSAGGQRGGAALFSYASPTINPNTLKLAAGVLNSVGGVYSYVNNPTTTGGQYIEFGGSFFGNQYQALTVRYGPVENPYVYTCRLNVATDLVSSSLLRCTTQGGIGYGLRFSVTTNFATANEVVSNTGSDMYNYPGPMITNSTLLTLPGGYPGAIVTSTTTQGEQIQFMGYNFGTAAPANILVKYGPVSNPYQYTCGVSADTRNDMIDCRTSPGQGTCTFTVFAGPGSSAQAVQGFDKYVYPLAPIIDAVSGCTNDVINGWTYDCPTDSGVISRGAQIRITITGQYFGSSGAQVTVGGNACFGVTHLSGSSISCLLPAGTGYPQNVIVNQGTFYSVPKPYLFYAEPSVTSVSGCPVITDVNNTAECARAGNNLITLYGVNFGAAKAKVLVGGFACTNPTHDASALFAHRRLTCRTPRGTALRTSVLVVQDKGKVSQQSVTLSYVQCSAGTYAANGVTACDNCPTGRFTSLAGQTSCVGCAPGTKAPSTGYSTCVACEVGSATNVSASVTCRLCAAGYFADYTGAVNCQQCAVGSFTPTTGYSICTPCAPGRFQPLTASTSCNACAIGSYVSVSGQTGCSPCPAGFNASAPGTVNCQPCPPGYVGDGVEGNAWKGSINCVMCSSGYYTPIPGQAQCQLCDPGSYSSSPASSTCTGCLPGKFANDTRLTTCYSCEPGWAGVSASLRSCSACRQGSYTNGFGYTDCVPCLPGTFQPNIGTTTCSPVTAGFFQNLHGQAGPVQCPPGYYTNGQGSTSCTPCDVGKSTPTTGLGASSCVNCTTGRYANVIGRPQCIDCAPGLYMDRPGATICNFCSAGTVQFLGGQTTCTACSVGFAATVPGSIQCLPCKAGEYAATNRSAACADCEVGRYSELAAQSTCLLCSPGTAVDTFKNTQCTECADGRYSNTSAQSVCTQCEVGRFSQQFEKKGVTVCSLCLTGTFADAPAFRVCLPCARGKYANTNGTVDCLPCDPGKYANSAGQAVCDPCPLGQSQAVGGQSICLDCDPGRFQNSTGQTSCMPCQEGKSQPDYGHSNCTNCVFGKFMAIEGQPLCTDCPQGRFSNVEGLDECTACPTGQYQTFFGLSYCFACPRGKHQDVSGQSRCLDCVQGTFTNETGRILCELCAPGNFQDSVGQLECQECQRAKYAFNNGSSICLQCNPGKFSNFTNQPECAPCVPGQYQDTPGSTSCKLAEVGKYSEGGVPYPTDCGDRTFMPNVGSSRCFQCGPNSDSDLARLNCLCDIDYFSVTPLSVNGTQLDCSECPRGANCDSRGTTAQSVTTDSGYWRENNDTLIWYACLLPVHCTGGAGGGEQLCGGNRRGPICAVCQTGYRSATGVSQCIKCPSNGASGAAVTIILILVVCALLLMYYIVLRSSRDLINQQRLRDRTGMEWDASSYYAHEHDDVAKRAAPVLSTEARHTDNITYKMKIMIGFLQIVTNLAFLVEIPWPQGFVEFMNAISFVNLDFVPWQSVGCLSSFDYYTKFLVLTCTPLGVLMLLVFFYLLPLYVSERRDMRDENTYRAAKKIARRKFWKLVTFTVFMLYPGVSSVVLSMFQCKGIMGTSYLIKDFSVICYDERWNRYLVAAVLMVIVWPIGIPAFMFSQLWRYRKRFTEPGIRVQLGFLYEAYYKDLWWFEMVDMVHKLCLTSIIAFFPRDFQMPLGMLVIGCYAILLLLRRPYIRAGDDRLHIFVQSALLLIVMAGYVLFYLDQTSKDGLDRVTNVVFSAVLIILVCTIFILFVVFSFRHLVLMFKDWHKKFNTWNTSRRQLEREQSKYQAEGGAADAHGASGAGGVGTGGGDDDELDTADKPNPSAGGSGKDTSKAKANAELLFDTSGKPLPKKTPTQSGASAGAGAKGSNNKQRVLDDLISTAGEDGAEPNLLDTGKSAVASRFRGPSVAVQMKAIGGSRINNNNRQGAMDYLKGGSVSESSVPGSVHSDESKLLEGGTHTGSMSNLRPKPSKARIAVPPLCEECDDPTSRVGFKCFDCDQWLCAACKREVHMGGKRKAHKIMPISELMKMAEDQGDKFDLSKYYPKGAPKNPRPPSAPVPEYLLKNPSASEDLLAPEESKTRAMARVSPGTDAEEPSPWGASAKAAGGSAVAPWGASSASAPASAKKANKDDVELKSVASKKGPVAPSSKPPPEAFLNGEPSPTAPKRAASPNKEAKSKDKEEAPARPKVVTSPPKALALAAASPKNGAVEARSRMSAGGRASSVGIPGAAKKDGESAPLCEECDAAEYTVWCAECTQKLCDDCSKFLHSKGKRKAHALVPIQKPKVCDECEKRNADVHCDACTQNLCNNCSAFLHKSGKRKAHTPTLLVPVASIPK